MPSEKPGRQAVPPAKIRADLERNLKALGDDLKAMREQGRREEAFWAGKERLKELFANAREEIERYYGPNLLLPGITPKCKVIGAPYDDILAGALYHDLEEWEQRATGDVLVGRTPRPLVPDYSQPPRTVEELLAMIPDPYVEAKTTGDPVRDRGNYLDARHLAEELREAQPTLPPLPPPAADPWAGLVALWDWANGVAQGGHGGRKRGRRVPILDKENRRIRVGREWRDLTDKQTDMLAILFEAKGSWVSGKTLKKRPDDRPDKVRTSMSPAVRELVKTNKSKGYCIPNLLP